MLVKNQLMVLVITVSARMGRTSASFGEPNAFEIGTASAQATTTHVAASAIIIVKAVFTIRLVRRGRTIRLMLIPLSDSKFSVFTTSRPVSTTPIWDGGTRCATTSVPIS